MRNRNILYFTGFFGNFFFERGIWILYLQHLSFSMLQIGILQSVLNFTMFIAEIPTGIISDRIGRKKALILGHMFITSYLAIFLCFDQFWWMFFGHVLYGIGITFISGTDHAYLYDSLKVKGLESIYSKSISIYNAMVIMGLAIAMLAGGMLQNISWSLVFIFGIAVQIIAILLALMLKEIKFQNEGDTPEISSFKSFAVEIGHFFKLNTSFKFLIISISTFFAITSVFYMFSQDLFSKSGLSVQNISILYGCLSLLQALCSVSAYKLEQKFSAKTTLMACFCIIGVLYTLLVSHNLIFIIISFVIINSLYDIIDPLSSKVINDELPSHIRATVLSLINLISSFMMFIAFPLLGYLSDYVNSAILMFVIGIVSIVVSITTITIYFKKNSHSQKINIEK